MPLVTLPETIFRRWRVGATASATAAWDAEYRSGRYQGEPPVEFVTDIVAAARADRIDGVGVYVGCGNGRNYLPLVDAGLDLIGLDISGVAIEQLGLLVPQRRHRLVHGGLDALPAERTYPLVVGIQVFQHGDRATTHELLRQAQQRVAPGGLFCVRVNAVGTDVWPDHETVEGDNDAGFTIRYVAGAKTGLLIHFFARPELEALCAAEFTPVLPLRRHRTHRTPPAPGQWSQWEGIWRRNG